LAEGVSVTVSDVNGSELGSCTTNDGTGFDNGSCNILVPVPEGTEVVIEVDESTVKPGYAPIENPITGELRTFESLAEAHFINVPEETFEYTVYKANCEEYPDLPRDEAGFDLPVTEVLPEGCSAAEGVAFTVYEYDDAADDNAEKGDELTRCTTDASGVCRVTLPWDPENGLGPYYVVEEDESTVTPGYSLIQNPQVIFYTPSGGDVPYANFINVPEEVDELPNTGAGLTTPPEPGVWAPVLLAGALLLTVVGIRARSGADG
jgi:hypothetical protein